MVLIVQKENTILRQIAKDVPILDIKKPKIKKILADMNLALNNEYDGVAIAAPQIGISYRIFIVSSIIFDEHFIRGEILNRELIEKINRKPNLIFINPIIKKISNDRKLMTEGCLSIRPLYGKVRRATRVLVEAYDENGRKFSMEGSGLLAHIFQHEIDHLNGILFTDKAKDIQHIQQLLQ